METYTKEQITELERLERDLVLAELDTLIALSELREKVFEEKRLKHIKEFILKLEIWK